MGIFCFWRNREFTFSKRCGQTLYFSHSPSPLPLSQAFLRSPPDLSWSSVRGLQLQRKNRGLWTGYQSGDARDVLVSKSYYCTLVTVSSPDMKQRSLFVEHQTVWPVLGGLHSRRRWNTGLWVLRYNIHAADVSRENPSSKLSPWASDLVFLLWCMANARKVSYCFSYGVPMITLTSVDNPVILKMVQFSSQHCRMLEYPTEYPEKWCSAITGPKHSFSSQTCLQVAGEIMGFYQPESEFPGTNFEGNG